LKPDGISGLTNVQNFYSITGVYDSELEAVYAVVAEMRYLTDLYNLEFMVIIYEQTRLELVDGKLVWVTRYYTSGVVAGQTDNVVAPTILGSIDKPPFTKIHLVHTHPDAQWYLNEEFSGDPEHPIITPGDASVPTMLGYESIYLLAPSGNLLKYEGWGSGPNQANTPQELLNIQPISSDNPPSTIRYLRDPTTGEYFPVEADH